MRARLSGFGTIFDGHISAASAAAAVNYGNMFASVVGVDPSVVFDFNHHKQEVCGLKWSFDEKMLASGGNDNKLMVWSVQHGHSNASTAGNLSGSLRSGLGSTSSTGSGNLGGGIAFGDLNEGSRSGGQQSDYEFTAGGGLSGSNNSGSGSHGVGSAVPHSTTSSSPMFEFSDHNAAVKAVAWSPHQQGLLSSGGGTADRHIRFWNTLTGTALHRIDTGSQVCNLMWSKNVNELVSTHGYSLNQVIVWKYPTMQKLATLTGHTLRYAYDMVLTDVFIILNGRISLIYHRVLYLAMSPDGQSIVTGAGDETLRFWNVFPSPKDRYVVINDC